MSDNKGKKVLVLGVTGMLGNAVLRYFDSAGQHCVVGSARSAAAVHFLPAQLQSKVVSNIDVENSDSLIRLFGEIRPQVVINCVGLVKQLADANDPLSAIPINTLLPHRLANLCAATGARLLHVSTDCVFAGTKGMYREDDAADAQDLYGRSKYLGEVARSHCVTLRTSMIGHELNSAHGLIAWFLAQPTRVHGYTKVVFSGLPTVELARVMHDFVVPRPELSGLYHVSAAPIDKYSLLRQVAATYGKAIDIVPDEKVVVDRSLDSTRFQQATRYVSPPWPELIQRMRDFG